MVRMIRFPKTLGEFQRMFSAEESCRQYLFDMRWPNGFCCPKCKQSGDPWPMANHYLRCRHCRSRISLLSGTMMEGSHKPLLFWFQAIWYVVNQKNGVSALGLQKALGFGGYRTAWTWLNKLRTAMVRPNRDRLQGIVEVDETLVGGRRSGKRGRGAEGKTLVLVAVEERAQGGMGRIRMCIVTDASGDSLIDAIKAMVAPGSTVRTDGWKGYNRLKQAQYNHIVVAHEEEELGTDPTPLVHRIASLLKRWLLGTHQGAVRASHLPYYLDEFTFRFNRRYFKSRGKLFYRLLEQCLQIPRVAGSSFKSSN